MVNISLGVKFSRTLRNGNALLVIAKRKRLKGIVEAGEEKRGSKRGGEVHWRWWEAGKSQCVTLCGILVFDGSLCYLISKVSLCVKMLLPLQQQQQFPV